MLTVRSRRVVLPDGERPAAIHVDRGVIIRIAPHDDVDRHAELVDAGDDVILPGLVDTHVHVNEPGRTEWEGFDTATRAAAAGGVTTIVDMPLNSVPATVDVAALDEKRASARTAAHVDVAFWGGIVPGNAGATRIIDALVDAGVRGFKAFLAPSGVDEFQAVGERELRDALRALARRGVPLLVHAELPEHLSVPSGRDYASFLESRPPIAEAAAIRLMARLAREYGARVHIVHVASAEAAAEVARAKSDGTTMTAETCPHYLTFDPEMIPEGATEFKCAPPIRAAPHRDALWARLRDGTLDLVATDHSPSPPSMKCPGDFARAWGGIASLELSLAAVWTGAGSRTAQGDLSPVHLAHWMCAAPAKLAGLDDRKGAIAPGLDADLVIWDPEREWTVVPAALQQRHKMTPYAGRTLRGAVRTTFLRGERVWSNGSLAAARRGHLL